MERYDKPGRIGGYRSSFVAGRLSSKDGAVQKVSFFVSRHKIVRSLIAHYCNMTSNRKKDSSASVTPSVLVGRPPAKYTVEDVVKLVRVSFLAASAKIDMVE